jgi:hypothetical protein
MKLRELIGLTKDWHVGIKQEKDKIFEDVVGYDDIKKIFRMALEVWNIILPKDDVVNVSSFDPPYTIFKPGILE